MTQVFAPEYRGAGLLLHVTSLPCRYGIGDVGPAAFEWIDRLSDAGQNWWQALPLGPTGYANSPYQALSSFAGNWLLISPDALIEEGLLRASDCEGRSFPSDFVDYDAVTEFKRSMVETAWDNFHHGASPGLRPAYEQFCKSQAHWLDDYALFRALKIRYNGAFYLDWPSDLVQRDPGALAKARQELEAEIQKVCFAQFLLFSQGGKLREYARAKGVRLIGDLPFFVSPDSSDVWANPEFFQLDKRHRPSFVAGVPPDYFSAQGQLWGNPVYDWDALKRTGYRWCLDRLRALIEHVDVIRLDHFRAFAAAWHVPAGAPTAQSGNWVSGPGADFLKAVQRDFGGLPFIAEDLGMITPDVPALRDRYQLPGMRVLQFGFDGDSNNPHLPNNYVHNSVAYTGTHDNNTTRGWFEALPDGSKQIVRNYLGRSSQTLGRESGGITMELIRLAWSSPAALSIAPLQDLLELGAEARMNVPGRAEGNWRWRCTPDMLSGPAFDRLHDLTQTSRRGRSGNNKSRCCTSRCSGKLRYMSSIPRQTVIEREDAAEEYGRSYPLGATIVPGGANFSVFSRAASNVELLLFDRPDDSRAARVIPLDPALNRTYHYWHAFVPGVRPGQIFGYRVNGPWDPANGMRFDPTKVLLDPYGRAVAVPKNYSRETILKNGDTAAAMKSVVVDSRDYDWEGDVPLKRPSSRTVIYELHVRGFTRHPNSGVEDNMRGTYRGLIQKIPHLRQLGISAVELLPIFQFDSQDAPLGLVNYWGYAPVSFFAPHHAYSSLQDPLGPVNEFRDMVKALHRAGIEVILDVVFNHTAEGDHRGPTISFRGLDNNTYYVLESDRSRYANYSGTGNTLNANHPIVRRMIVDSLRYWVQEMHVDGFRFDLASILARDSSGKPMLDPPVLLDIESDPTLAGTKMIAEAWDAAGLYQVGTFTGDSWREWNGRFRDDVRSFFRGDEGSAAQIADRLLGSPQIYGHKDREAEVSVNFVTCHDGFTLNDLVSYSVKRNEANGESNRDGANDNRSWNCGVEGPTDDAAVHALRNRHVKNLLTCTMISLGMPMIGMGDEVRRTQHGNNNAYCQDNETSWFDWSLISKHADVHRFMKLLIERRLLRGIEDDFMGETLNQWLRESHKSWHGVKLNQPDWSNWSHSVAFSAELVKERLFAYWILNAYWEPLDFELPVVGGEHQGVGPVQWRRWIDTSLDSPNDIVPWQDAPTWPERTYRVGPHSIAILYAPVASAKSISRP